MTVLQTEQHITTNDSPQSLYTKSEALDEYNKFIATIQT
jgi:hypothetical protein